MSTKRRNTSSPECESPPAKRHHSSAAKTPLEYDGPYDDPDAIETGEKAQVNASTGQAGAFPGLGDNEDELFYGPAQDGIDYLRMVRSERRHIPELLSAQQEKELEAKEHAGLGEQEDKGGYWCDGAYTALPTASNGVVVDRLPKAQTQYYSSLLIQFAQIRTTMRCVPPLSAIEKLTSSQPISFPPRNRKARTSWLVCVKTKEPSPTQIACMDQSSILELVKLMTIKMRGLLESNSMEVTSKFGAWIWAVLGKCPNRGELGSEEIAELRQLAAKAINTRNWIEKAGQPEKSAPPDSNDEDSEYEDDGAGTAQEIRAEIEAATRRLAQEPEKTDGNEQAEQTDAGSEQNEMLDEAKTVEKQKLMVLDTILTIVGDVYGQRDLLDERRAWTSMNGED